MKITNGKHVCHDILGMYVQIGTTDCVVTEIALAENRDLGTLPKTALCLRHEQKTFTFSFDKDS